jgi:capsular exopolysaccharide synthesis family protein
MPVEKRKVSIIDMDDLRSVWNIFSKNWYVFLIFVSFSAVLSYFYTYKLSSVYAAKSQILLKNDETYDYQNSLYSGLGYYQAYQDNSNQIKVITSNDLISKTLSKIKVDISYYIVGRVKTTEVYESMPFNFVIKPLYSGLYEQKMKFNILSEKQYQLAYNKDGNEIVKIFPFNQEIVDSDFILSVYTNDNINNKTILSLKEIDYLVQVHNPSNLVYAYKSALSVENTEGTSILELTVEDLIPYRAIAFLDTLSKVYIDYTAQAQYKINENTLINIDKQLSGVVSILDSLENDLENFKANKSILDLPKQEGMYFEQLIGFDSKKRGLELWIQSLDALEKYILTVDASKDDKLLPPSFYIGDDDEYLKTTINELYSMQMSRNKILYGATKENKGIENLDQTMELLKRNMLTYISNSKKGLLQKIEELKVQMQDYTNIIKGVPKTQRELLNIQRKVDVNQRMYVYLLEKRANTVIARAGILPQTAIIETAHSVGIVKPDKNKIFYYFILGGAIFSFIIIFIRSIFFYTVENMTELKKLTNLTVLGEIVFAKNLIKEGYNVVDQNPKAHITENFRTIRTNLDYLAADLTSKIVLITSYSPGEGKTFCSINLATIIAKANKKVLLIELDLHKPKVQKALKMYSDIGVSTILIGKTDISSTIQETQIDNLKVLLSGPSPPNASEIILSNRLKELLIYSRENFDYVIIDTPPVGLISDALVLSKHVDIVLFVLNANVAKRKTVAIAEELRVNNKITNFGFILNGVKRNRGEKYYSYGYENYITDKKQTEFKNQ